MNDFANTVPRKICVVTGTRAEYGLLSNVMREIQKNSALQLQVVACAAHLSKKHGMTVNHILADGFTVDAQVTMLDEHADSHVAVAKAVAKGVAGFADVFEALHPDCILILGDRYEMLAAAQTALLLTIPIAHIHGGEVTEGAMDEAIRHAITKMASLHFTAAEPYRQRVIQMGEQPESVFNVGAPGLDVIKTTPRLSLDELQTHLQATISRPLCLVTYHPVTWAQGSGVESLKALFNALETLQGATIIWTGANADQQGRAINSAIKSWVQSTNLNAHFVTSLGSQRYLSLMALADVVVGNSSSGIIEAPALGVPTVNIGPRQQGRLRSSSIIDCDDTQDAMILALNRALSADFQALAQQTLSVYGSGQTAQLISATLATFPFKLHMGKAFYDLP